MPRTLVDRHPRRLLRLRTEPRRPEHGLDIALRATAPDGDAAQRADQRALRALADENAVLARELGRVQARCTQWRDEGIAQADRLEAALMRARGELIAKDTLLAIERDVVAALRQHRSAPTSLDLAACRVLCVGGRARQVPVYRELVERRGGRFAHRDGAATCCLNDLARALSEADLVILQAGYVCQGVCQAVEAHCARTGVRRVQLDKTCALGFARALQQALAA